MRTRLPQTPRPKLPMTLRRTRLRPRTTAGPRRKSDPRAHDIAVYPLFCEGLICSFRAGEGLDRGEIVEQIAALPIVSLHTFVVVSERVPQLGRSVRGPFRAGQRQGIVGDHLEILLRRNIDSP